ncbi:MAG: TnpV protein [Clostridiales bacterium]|nr:TnpV protein [Clostridiales bacterium]
MKDEFVKSIGIWGQRHYDYLRKNKPMVINVMRMNGTLERYLQDTDRNAHEMFDKLMKEFAEFEGVTEQLKASNQLSWVRRMNNIRERVTEVVNAEMVFV